MSQLTHLTSSGNATMVNISHKPDTERVATARGRVLVNAETFALVRDGNLKKGDVFATARLAGMMAAKRTAELIPLCHPIALTHIEIKLSMDAQNSAVQIEATARCTGKTGVEMEALTAASIAALTVYDMAKAVQRDIKIDDIRLVEKRGGQSGDVVLE